MFDPEVEEFKRELAEKGIADVWNTDEVREHFEILGFCAPYCTARRKSDGKKGTLQFNHMPRLYFNFVEG